jgi:hypothetical protein
MQVMIFRRKPIAGPELITVPAVASVALPDDASLPLVDAVGAGFELLREMDLGCSLWRTAASTDLDQVPDGQIIVVAAYAPGDITQARALMGQFMTIILGMGLGPHYGSQALQLGAVGYLDGSLDQSDIRGLFGDAVARVRNRRLRAGSGIRLN